MFKQVVLAVVQRAVDASLVEARRRVAQLSATLDHIEDAIKRVSEQKAKG